MKRVLAFLLSLCLVISLLPVSVFTALEVSAEPAAHDHRGCTCALTGGNACAGHGTEAALTWQAWTNTATLPTTTGNYYLTGNITLTNTAAMSVAAGQTVVLCLNGYSVQFNAGNTGAANYSVASGAKLTIMNCQAKLDAKGLFVSGNKANPSDLTAGRLYGGRGNKGGAIYTEGEVNLIGVELYDNGKDTLGYGGAVLLSAGGVLNAIHAKFDSNKAKYGAVVANNNAGNATLTFDDCVLSNNIARYLPSSGSKVGNGGAIYLKTYADTTQDVVLTVKGDSRIADNESYSSGSAIYATSANSPSLDAVCRVVLQDNVVITGNEATRTGSTITKGAVGIDAGANSKNPNVLTISGNVQVYGNGYVNTNANSTGDVFITHKTGSNKNELEVGEMGANAYIHLRTEATYTDPDSFAIKAAAAQIADNASLGIVYENSNKGVYYKQDGGFYLGDVPTVPAAHTNHFACACAITDGNACAGHGSDPALTWTEWTDTTTLPTTTGNYYLTGNITLTNTAAMSVAAGQTVVLCLNGYSVQFNAANTAAANYSVAAGAKLTIMNCQAKLDNDGLFVSGNKADPSNLTAGRLYGGRGNMGGAIFTQGEVNLIGVELYDNGVSGSGFGGAVRLKDSGAMYATHAKFAGNKAGYGGAFANYNTGSATVTLDDTIVTNNAASSGGMTYWKVYSGTTTDAILTIKGDSKITGNSASGSGGAIYVTQDTAPEAACKVIVQDNVQITGNTTGSKKGAVAMDVAGNAKKVGLLSVSGNAQIADNNTTNTAADAAKNVYLNSAKAKVEVGAMGSDADVRVRTTYSSTAPNDFVVAATGAAIASDTPLGIACENTDPAKEIAYNTTEGFHFYTAPVVQAHTHHACACAITGGNACAGHGTEAELNWTAWTDTTTLPTATGNYYLTGNITLTNTAAMTIAAAQDVKLCLNGFNVQFNAANTAAANYSVAAGAKLTVMNCQAELDAKGLLVSDGTGRLHGGCGNAGGAIYTAGDVNLLGVELYNNGVTNSGNGGAVQLVGGTLNALHSKFDSNKAKNGGVFHVTSGSPVMTLDDVIVCNNVAGNASSGSGGVIDMRVYTATTQDVVLTVKGDSTITGNSSGGSGSVAYVSQFTDAADTAACKIILQDNVVISGNTVNGTSVKGAIAMDIGSGAKKVGTLSVSGNVQVKDNLAASTTTNATNVYLHSAKAKVEVGTLGADAQIAIKYSASVTDPDSILIKAAGAQITEDTALGITYNNTDPAKDIAYNTTDGFYFYVPYIPPVADHFHHACTCVITGGNACAGHGTEAELGWVAWTDTTTLPTATGNYYLTGNITLTNTAAMTIAAGQDVKLCLNGFNVQFNAANTAAANYSVAAGAKLTVMNCKAALDAKGLLVSNGTGRLYGGKGNKGGAIYTAGEVNLMGVELSENGKAGSYRGGAVSMTGNAKLTAVHTKFDSNKANYGGAIDAYESGNATITLDDTVLSNNEAIAASSGNGGAIYLRSYSAGTQDLVLTIQGDSQITGNKSYSSGSAIYASTENDPNATKAVRIVVQDNVVISGNEITRAEGASKGAISMDTGANSGKDSVLAVSGNVQIKDNAVTSANTANAKNVFMVNDKVKLEIGELGADADVWVKTASVQSDPDDFITLASGVTMQETTDIGVTYESVDPAMTVGYNDTEKFYLYDPTIPVEPHIHHACACVITGETGCTHSAELTWKPWTSATTLPTSAGNWYLTRDVHMADGVVITNAVNICLNGYSVQYNENYTSSTGINAKEGSALTIMNCQAKVDEQNLLVCGNKADPSNQQAGRLFGGRGKWGGAIYVAGTVNLIGVELYDNQSGYNYGGAVFVTEGVLNTYSTKFDNNYAKSGGSAIANASGNVAINLHDTVITNNANNVTAAGGAVYIRVYGTDTATTKDVVLTISGNSKIYGNYAKGSGAAIYVCRDSEVPADITAHVVLKDNVVITDNHGGSAKGAVTMDTTAADKTAYVDISGNVQIFGNTSTAGNGNLYLNAARHQIRVGKLGDKAKVYVTTSGAQGDPDGFLKLAEGVKLDDTAKTGFVYENIDPFVPVGYKNDKNVQFYFAVEGEDHFHQACQCAITGDTACQEAENVEWIPWLYADKLPTASGNYYLTKDVTVKSTGGAGSVGQFEIKEGQSVNLCMNGFNIQFYDKNTDKGNYYAMIGSQLTILNCKAELDKDGKLVDKAKNGGVISGGMGRYGGAVYIKGDAKLIGIAFVGNKAAYDASEGMGGAVRVQDGGKLLVKHCLFEKNEALGNGGAICTGRGEAELTIEDSVFTKNTAGNYGGAIAMNSKSAKLTITDSVIENNKATTTGGGIYAKTTQMKISGVTVSKNDARNGGGIYITTDSALDITDSVIKGNTGVNCGGLYAAKQSKVTLGKDTVICENEADAGGGVILQTKTELTFAGGVIENNKAKSGGGMTLWDQSVVYLKDGKIAGNEATVGAGGGIYMQSGADLHVSGGSITENKSKTYGAGVHANMNDKVKEIEITVSGGEISKNETEGTGGGIYALSGKITVSGGKIADNVAKSAGGGVYLGSSSAAGEVLGNFTMTGGEISGNKAATGGGVFHSTNSDALYSGGILTKNVATTSGGAIHTKKARITLEKDILITENQSKSGGAICLQNETQMDFKGGKVEKNTGSSGGGFMLWSKSVLNLNGGLIQNNKSTGSGGGVYMQSGSYLYVNSGKITRNTATKAGGAVFSNGNNTDRMTIKVAGGEIANNTAGTQGGGVYVGGAKAGSAMTMTGGYVKNNTAVEQQGGGIYVAANCSMTMWGGSVSGNFTKQTGGGIYVSKGTLVMYGGAVSANKCDASGGGIHTSGGKLDLHGGTISYNYAGAYGGGIRTYNSTEFTMTGGNILYNEAENRGGGVALWGNMTMTGGAVSYNAAIGDPDGKDINVYGGGIAICDNNSVYVKEHYTLDITGGEFIGNTSINKGGALSVTGECYLYVKDSVFKENEAVLGGAIIADNHANNRSVPSELYVTNCQFTGNKAENGGAIYGNWSSETTVEGSVFTDNTATQSGGAIHLRSQSIAWLSTSSFMENTAGQKGAAIYCADDVEMDSLTVTGNNSGDGYALYIEEGAFDGISVVKAIVKINGDMKVFENIGAKPDMFIAKDAMVHVGYDGLGKDTKIDLELAEGILTNTLIGVYNYEGGNLKYTVTYGDRSITDPEVMPVANGDVEDTTAATEPAATEPGAQSSIGIGGIAAISGALVVAVIAVIAAVAVKKKKKAEQPAKDTVQE